MSDDTTRPFAEPFPLPIDLHGQAATLRRHGDELRAALAKANHRINILTAERESQAGKHLRQVELLGAVRDYLHETQQGAALSDRITDLIGGIRSAWYEQPHGSVPIQGQA